MILSDLNVETVCDVLITGKVTQYTPKLVFVPLEYLSPMETRLFVRTICTGRVPNVAYQILFSKFLKTITVTISIRS